MIKIIMYFVIALYIKYTNRQYAVREPSRSFRFKLPANISALRIDYI